MSKLLVDSATKWIHFDKLWLIYLLSHNSYQPTSIQPCMLRMAPFSLIYTNIYKTSSFLMAEICTEISFISQTIWPISFLKDTIFKILPLKLPHATCKTKNTTYIYLYLMSSLVQLNLTCNASYTEDMFMHFPSLCSHWKHTNEQLFIENQQTTSKICKTHPSY